VRLWGWEAIAHGAEVVSYFRWRQAPFAQEQNHAALMLCDGSPDTAAEEVALLSQELAPLQALLETPTPKPAVAIVFDYVSNAALGITAVAGADYQAFQAVADVHSACRRCGLDVDIVSQHAPLDGYKMIIVANAMIESSALVSRLQGSTALVLLLPGCGSRTDECAIPASLAPGAFRSLIDLTVNRTESLPACASMHVSTPEANYLACIWRERVVSELTPRGKFDDGWGFHYVQGHVHYLNSALSQSDLQAFIRHRLVDAGVAICDEIDGMRYRRCGSVQFAFNYGPDTVTLSTQTDYLLGQAKLAPGEVAAWSGDSLQ